MEENKKNRVPNVPNLRFSVFNGEWICTSLSKISYSLEYGIGASAVDYDGQHRYIRITDISNYSDNERNFVSPSFLDNKAILKEGDILLARTGATVGDSFIFKSECDYNAYYAGFLIRARIRNNNPYFIYYQLKTYRYNKWVKIMSARSGQPGINSQEYGSFAIYLPSIQEQDKVALLLRKIDMRIDSQNKIIEELKTLKSGLLNKLFPLKGMCKYGTEMKLVSFLNPGAKDPVNPNNYKRISIHLNYGGLSFVDSSKELKDARPFFVRRKGELIIGKQNYFNGSVCLVEEVFDNTVCSNAIMSFSIVSINPFYLLYSVSNKSYLKAREFNANGTGQKELSEKAFLNFSINVPDVKIQHAIAELIGGIEKKILNNAKLLERFRLEKDYLLSNMFI